jgi:hypothetical protein
MGAWIALVWLRTGARSKLLWTRWWTFSFHKNVGNLLTIWGTVSFLRRTLLQVFYLFIYLFIYLFSVLRSATVNAITWKRKMYMKKKEWLKGSKLRASTACRRVGRYRRRRTLRRNFLLSSSRWKILRPRKRRQYAWKIAMLIALGLVRSYIICAIETALLNNLSIDTFIVLFTSCTLLLRMEPNHVAEGRAVRPLFFLPCALLSCQVMLVTKL